MEPKYAIFGGQQAAVGDGATASFFTQLWDSKGAGINLADLANELDTLKAQLALYAKDGSHHTAIGEISGAAESAKKGNGSVALEHLKKAGNWVWDIAQKVGVGLAVAAARSAIGIP